MMAEKFIQKALSKPGSRGKLHRELGVPEGEKIPAKKMAKAAKSKSPTIRKEVAFAKTLSKLRRK
jgi:hypothetical protein